MYFVALHLFRDLRWGTPEPVYIPDPVLMQVPVRGHGRFTVRVSDPPAFVAKMVGTRAVVRTRDVEDFLRSQYLVSALTTATASLGRPFNELARHYRELGTGVKSVLGPEFAGLGLELTDLSVNSITTTEEVQALMTGHSQTAGDIHLARKAAAADPVAKIRQLKDLLDVGAISAEEFEAKKAELLRQV